MYKKISYLFVIAALLGSVVARPALEARQITTFEPNHQFATVNGLKLHFVDQAPSASSTPKGVVVLLHGWPDCWYSWRHQIPVLTAAGYRVIAPDLRGFCLSQGPADLLVPLRPDYTYKAFADDVIGILQVLGIQPKVHFVGHDWGSVIMSRVALHHADWVETLSLMSVPYFAPSSTQPSYPGVTVLRKATGGMKGPFAKFGYQSFFETDHYGAVKELNDDVEKALLSVFRNWDDTMPQEFLSDETRFLLPNWQYATKELPRFFTQADFDFYVSMYKNTTFGKTLDVYAFANRFQNYEDDRKFTGAGVVIPVPVLMLAGKQEPVTPPQVFLDRQANGYSITKMELTAPRMVRFDVNQASHFPQQEQPACISCLLVSFLDASIRDSTAVAGCTAVCPQ
jgi:pimeloyl-ACP methyl ester carboxylesterase